MAPAFKFSLESSSGVPIYRQIIDQVLSGIAAGSLRPGMQLPTVRQTAVDLSVNLNTVARAYRDLETRGVLNTQQGSGTYISKQVASGTEFNREKRLLQIAQECAARAGSEGFTLQDLLFALRDLIPEEKENKELL
jgi:GntR family transcriptional regulator